MYALARKSTVRMIVDMIENFDRASYYDWDAHAEGADLPKTDLIGLSGFACSLVNPFHDLTFSVAIMVHDDPNLGRLVDYTDRFYNRLLAHQRYPVFMPDGTQDSHEIICFDGTQAAPMSRVDFRPTMEITVSARLTKVGEWQE